MQDRIKNILEAIQRAEDCSYPDSRPELIKALHSQASIIQELQALNEWQDISTIPDSIKKDGTWILLTGGKTNEDDYSNQIKDDPDRPVVAKWGGIFLEKSEDEGEFHWLYDYWDGSWFSIYENPTHYKLLDKPCP